VAGLANPPGFGGKRWGEIDWSRFNRLTNAPFSVGSSTDWQPTINTGVNRTINISAGMGQAYGVYDLTDTTETIAFAANATGADRYDALVARFDWTAKTRVFAVITGGASPPAIQTGGAVDAAKVNRLEGARYDGYLAIIKVRPGATIFQPGDIAADMRVWGGATGSMVSNAPNTYRSSLHVPVGGQVTVNGLDTFVRKPDGTLFTTRPRMLAVGTGTQTISFGVAVPMVLSNTVIAQGVTYNPANGRCTFIEAGDYWCSATAAYNATANYRGVRNIALGRNGTQLDYTISSSVTNDADALYVNTSLLLHFEAGEYLTAITSHEAEVIADGTNSSAVLNRARCQLSAMYAGG
jgi:hypothetical protein